MKDSATQAKVNLWAALSTLFLDTEIDVHLEQISSVCAASQHSIDELQQILFQEVAPVCMPNMLTVAGEWTGFDEEQLVTKILEHKNKKQSAFGKLLKPQWGIIARLYIGKDWQKVSDLIKQKRR